MSDQVRRARDYLVVDRTDQERENQFSTLSL